MLPCVCTINMTVLLFCFSDSTNSGDNMYMMKPSMGPGGMGVSCIYWLKWRLQHKSTLGGHGKK